MTAHEIRPRQLRTLLLLLVLVPLIPGALMVRFMLDTLKVERLAALDRLQQLHGETLSSALRTTSTTADLPVESRARAVIRSIQKLGSEGTTIRVVSPDGTVIAGEARPWGQPIAEAIPPFLDGASVQMYLIGPEVLDEAISDQRRILLWTGVLTLLSVVVIAGGTALALHRQIALKELKNTSVATVAHELRTPLASMRMLVDTLREGRYRGENQMREYLDLVALENQRLARLAETFLSFSRLDQRAHPLSRTLVKPSTLVEDAIAPLRSRLEAPDCTFKLEVAPDLPDIHVDADALSQVLSNLLDNALKYTGTKKEISLRVHREGEQMVFAIGDNGLGIPSAERKSIFQPFYQVDQKLSRSREGCGLGLSIVRSIVVAHKGKIDVASEPGKGSVFTVRIPVA